MFILPKNNILNYWIINLLESCISFVFDNSAEVNVSIIQWICIYPVHEDRGIALYRKKKHPRINGYKKDLVEIGFIVTRSCIALAFNAMGYELPRIVQAVVNKWGKPGGKAQILPLHAHLRAKAIVAIGR